MRLQAFIDGASRGNPGPASVGVVLQDAAGKVLKEHHRFLGRETNNVAEYSAMIDALRLASGLGARELRVHSDSELLVRQLNGEYRIKNPRLKELFGEVLALRRSFERVTVVHVPRERNREADRLANQALDEAAAGRSPGPAPGPAQPDLFGGNGRSTL